MPPKQSPMSSSMIGGLPLLRSPKPQNSLETPMRITDFFRNFNQIGKVLQAEEKAKLKEDFLKEEKKHVRKFILDKENQQETRRKIFQATVKDFEYEFTVQQQEDKKQQHQHQLFKKQQFELELQKVNEADLDEAEKVKMLQQLLEQAQAIK